jgi:hypothetical protein
MKTSESIHAPQSNQSTTADVVPIVKAPSCCPPVEQATCCEQSAKASCCGTAATSGGGCGCR